MATALGILLTLLVAVVLLALLPWHLRFRARTAPAELRVDLRLLAGHAPAIPLTGGKRRDKPARDRKKRPAAGRASRHLCRLQQVQGVGALLAGLLSAFRLRDLELDGRIGTGDPADTGTLWGCLTPLIYGPGQAARRIEIVPDFAHRVFELSAAGTLAIRPDRVLGTGLRFAWVNRGMLFSRDPA